jgi:ACS family hexuronate transporter-like MFS transporter
MGGSLSAWLKARFGTPIVDGKRMVFTLGALLMVAMAGVGLVSNPATAIFLLCLGGFAHQTLSVAVISMSADLFPRREVATVTGLVALIAGLGNLAFTLVIGALVGLVGYTPFFVVLGFLDLIGAAILWTAVKPATELLGEPLPGAGGLGGTDSHRGTEDTKGNRRIDGS